jgi:hypothetical protein
MTVNYGNVRNGWVKGERLKFRCKIYEVEEEKKSYAFAL